MNGLLPWVFGIDPVYDTGRGFATLDEYLAHAKCARFVVRRLYEVRERAPAMVYKRDVPAVDVSAGTSLYFFQDRAAVYMPFRWFWQCVVLDENEATGAASHWLTTLASPTASDDSLQCANYVRAPDADADRSEKGTVEHKEVTLATLLRQSRHIFGGSDGLTAADNWIHDDILLLVSEALTTMQLTTLPNVECVSAVDGDSTDAFAQLFPEVDDHISTVYKHTSPLTRTLQLGDIDDMVIDSVRKYLWESGSGDVTGYSEEAFVLLTTADMQARGMMASRSLNALVHEDAVVVPGKVFTGLEYVALKQTMPKKYLYPYAAATGFSKAETEGGAATAYAAPDSACDGFKLTDREFGVLGAFENPNRARDPRVRFVPEALLRHTPGDRFLQDRAFFTQEQVRYLVLQFMRVYMPLQASMHGDKLVAVRDPEVRDAMRLHADSESSRQYLHEGAFHLDRYKRYNLEMQRKTYECDEFTSIDYEWITNDGFQELRQCYQALQVKTGWVVQHDEFLHLVLTADMMTQGFFAAFAAHEPAEWGEFVDNMTRPEWASAAWRGEDQHQKCFSRAGQAELMNPALPGLFDTNIGCETARDADGTWTVDSACDETCNEREPGLAAWLADYMPAGCAARHDGIVARPQRLNKHYHTPVCDMRFQPSSVCTRAHGTLGGRRGVPATDLYASKPAGVMSGGLWGNAVLRGAVDADAEAAEDADADGADALSLLRTDIGGHALEFAVRALACVFFCSLSLIGARLRCAYWLIGAALG